MSKWSVPSRSARAAVLFTALHLGPASPGLAAEEQSEAMTDAVRASLTMGARHLMDQIETTNGWTWLLQPYKVQHGSMHVRSVTNYYSYKMVEHKVYKHEKRTVWYEEFETKVLKPSSSPGDPPKVVTVKKRRRINSPADAKNPRYVKKGTVTVRVGEPTGTRKVKQLVRDPNGSVSKVHQIRSPGQADYWPTGFLGQNAMALLALLKCGIPEDDENVMKLANTLNGAAQGYHAPDTTVDLAWLAAAFANLKGHQWEQTRAMLISKVADGQIKEGKCRGLWGPVCVNTEMLGRALAYQNTISQRMMAADGRKKKGEENEKVLADLEYIADVCKRVSQQGLRFSDIKKHYVLGINDWIGENDVIIEGLPVNIYKTTLADMESTGLALYALREGAANGCLPEKTWRPQTKRGSAFRWPAPELVSAVLARAAAAISKLAATNAQWPECNMHQMCNDFVRIAIPPVDAVPLGILPNPINTISSMRACAALLDVGHAVGMDRMVQKFGPAVSAADSKRRELVDVYLTQSPELRTSGYCDFLTPEFFFKSSGIQKHHAGTGSVDPATWKRLVVHAVRTQDANGSWPDNLPDKYLVKTTAEWHGAEIWERNRIKEEIAEAQRRAKAKLKGRGRGGKLNWPEPPQDSTAFWATYMKGTWFYNKGKWRAFQDTVAPTAHAMLFLTEGKLDPPPIVYLTTKKDEPPPRMLSTAAHLLMKNKKATIRYAAAAPDNANIIEKAPLAFLGPASVLGDEKISTALKKALDSGMMLVVDGAKARDSKLIIQLTRLSGGKLGPVPANAPALVGLRLKLEGLVRPDGTIAVLLLPWGTGARLPAGVLSGNQALQIAARVLTHANEKQKSSGELVIDPNTTEDMGILRTSALARLGGGLRPPPHVTTKAPAKAGVPPAAAQKEQPPLKADEVW
ncbi:hypothetical protein ACFLQU_01535 [Verrucomicrobiota bacterium]